MLLIPDKRPSRSYYRGFRYAVVAITGLLVILYVRSHDRIHSNITMLRQCRSEIIAKQRTKPDHRPSAETEVKEHKSTNQSSAARSKAAAQSSAFLSFSSRFNSSSSEASNSTLIDRFGYLNRSDSLLWTEKSLEDGSLRYDCKGTAAYTPLIILSMSFDEGSWATTFDFSRARNEEDFLDLVANQIDISQVSFGFITASMVVYERLKNATSTRDIGRTTIIYRKATNSFPVEDRHKDEIQYERRSSLAVIRNVLMSRALQDEKHIFWLDSDIIDMTPDLITTMIKRAESNKEEVGLITARSDLIGMANYDRNAWNIDRNVEGILLAVKEDEREHLNHRMMDTRRYIPEQTRGLKGDQLGRLDSVGGTSLYVRADLIRNGVNFPPFKVVGTTWGQGGWTGQETEGICYVAKQISGVNCWSLGDSHYTTHAMNI